MMETSESSCESFIKTEHASNTATHTHTRRTTVDSHIPSTRHKHHHPKHHPACETRSFISRTAHPWIHRYAHQLSPFTYPPPSPSSPISTPAAHLNLSPSAHSQGTRHQSSFFQYMHIPVMCLSPTLIYPGPTAATYHTPAPPVTCLPCPLLFQVMHTLSLH
ncbi:hypothetical protein E2C01_028417 [Portunus trituberculatus]|uniref:Uncharacterized protein n=1 Tax=Portunus trituberculatus TaxID=210409 RepID=A0A5B7EKE4_PORTR|nr:hypothetical protein [Portunus trituberculatus]